MYRFPFLPPSFHVVHFKQFQIEFAYLWYEATKRDQQPLHDVFLCNLFSRFTYMYTYIYPVLCYFQYWAVKYWYGKCGGCYYSMFKDFRSIWVKPVFNFFSLHGISNSTWILEHDKYNGKLNWGYVKRHIFATKTKNIMHGCIAHEIMSSE